VGLQIKLHAASLDLAVIGKTRGNKRLFDALVARRDELSTPSAPTGVDRYDQGGQFHTLQAAVADSGAGGLAEIRSG